MRKLNTTNTLNCAFDALPPVPYATQGANKYVRQSALLEMALFAR